MMNPWDRERTYQQPEGTGAAPRSNMAAFAWIVAVIVAAVALFAMARHGGGKIVAVPIGISLFFMMMFWISHRRESRLLAQRREMSRLNRAAGGPLAPRIHPESELEIVAEPGTVAAPRPATHAAHDRLARVLFDKFDLMLMAYGRDAKWEPKEIVAFMEFARDFLDIPYATGLLRESKSSYMTSDLEHHLDAAMGRALLQYEVNHGARPKPPEGYRKSAGDLDPPF